MPNKLILCLASLLIANGSVYALSKNADAVGQFNCKDKKWIKMGFFEEPVPYVALELSDGRKFNLAQTMSASGVRYSNIPVSKELWIKGNRADLYEGPDNGDLKPTLEECMGKE